VAPERSGERLRQSTHIFIYQDQDSPFDAAHELNAEDAGMLFGMLRQISK
jgi:hypothetical protein